MDLGVYLNSISKRLHESADSLDCKILDALSLAGQKAVEIARNSKTYKDDTGNLTASIGYGVFHYGKSHSIGGFGGGVGEQEGVKKLMSVAANHASKPYIVVIVAGMSYALFVERRGYVVLDGASLQLDSVLNSELNKINISI